MKEVISIPNALRTFQALRNLGYDLFSSIADVVDNSITDKVAARNIQIKLNLTFGKKFCCQIQDDGCGMDQKELEEAMRLGTETTYEDNDLGKFGMGMKTASLSHCNVLTVISKRENSTLCGYRWDISKIEETQKWTLLRLSGDEIQEILIKENLSLGKQGTIVFWDNVFNLDREIRSYTSEKLASNYYFRLLTKLKLHLGMIYHRFLDGSLDEEDSLNILVNESPLVAWDPFCREEEKTEEVVLKRSLRELCIPDFKTPIKIKAYILPSKKGFSSEENWKNAKGLLSWNDSQGYYIYRANRIIRFGGWHNTKAKDEHDKLARISIDIDPSLDELFRITVNKTRVQFPEILSLHLKSQLNPKVIKKAKARYNKSEDKFVVKNNFRKHQGKVDKVSRGLLEENKIKTATTRVGKEDAVQVKNPSGYWISNKIHEFLKYGGKKDYEIISGDIEDGQLWKIVCDHNDKFKVVVNASHPFYKRIYAASNKRGATGAVDALLFSLAFAELYNKNDSNAHLFDTFKEVVSQTLERLIKEEIV